MMAASPYRLFAEGILPLDGLDRVTLDDVDLMNLYLEAVDEVNIPEDNE